MLIEGCGIIRKILTWALATVFLLSLKGAALAQKEEAAPAVKPEAPVGPVAPEAKAQTKAQKKKLAKKKRGKTKKVKKEAGE
ncbi:MAG: hypothetical protein A2Y80_03165 [Deltaproteobacteria bacterium RBG_13_58_19]|nr:MAG: hypothetical protein A2Y80_03165 [Deltaproteobacteria bacterium RBG_13_58_19]